MFNLSIFDYSKFCFRYFIVCSSISLSDPCNYPQLRFPNAINISFSSAMTLPLLIFLLLHVHILFPSQIRNENKQR
uniref:Uncharacterized protein n=1 Tax=Lepeophtheirus salmonis TaxID=72036 RepID=A0A0K2VIR3_LEPSM